MSPLHVGRQPAAVRKRDHPVLGAVPDGDRDADGLGLESPRPGESQVVIAPAVDTVGYRATKAVCESVGEFLNEGGPVDVGHQTTERVGNLPAGECAHPTSLALEELDERLLASDPGSELGDVLWTHTLQPVEAADTVWGDAGDGGLRHAPQYERIGYQARAFARAMRARPWTTRDCAVC